MAEAVSPYISHPEDAGEEPDRDVIRELWQGLEASQSPEWGKGIINNWELIIYNI